MREIFGLLAALVLAAPEISYFRYERPVESANTSGEQYLVADETLWLHARPGLEDVRLYSSGKEIPYVLEVERGRSESEEWPVRVLQPGKFGGKTQFLLDMSGVPEYERVELKLDTKNFVAHAFVEGQDDPHSQQWAALGTTTLYDLSGEHLGRNCTLQIARPTTYKYLRVTIDNSVEPKDVQQGTAGITRAQEAVWRRIPSSPSISQKQKDTVLSFDVPKNVPAERFVLEIDPAQGNFLRQIEVQSDTGQWYGLAEISRIHMTRRGQKIDMERNSADIHGTGHEALRVVIHNGDDPPLRITGAFLQQYQRRIYFDSTPLTTGATLFYGDERLTAPVYEYAKLFQKDSRATQAQLGAEEANGAYTGRPDERPWSERHPGILWAAIIAAVMILGGIALRSMRAAAA